MPTPDFTSSVRRTAMRIVFKKLAEDVHLIAAQVSGTNLAFEAGTGFWAAPSATSDKNNFLARLDA